MREIKGHMVAHVDAPEILGGEPGCKRAGVEIVHVFMDGNARWDQGIGKQDIEVIETFECFRRDIDVRV